MLVFRSGCVPGGEPAKTKSETSRSQFTKSSRCEALASRSGKRHDNCQTCDCRAVFEVVE